jgi:SAM-dependent methyltransferase
VSHFEEQKLSDYDPFAAVYNKYWTAEIAPQMIKALDELLLPQLCAKGLLLDLCCGTGQIAAALIKRGFSVTGLDQSKEMITLARRNAPAAKFIVRDARSFRLPAVYHSVISMFDSLNHILDARDLLRVFRHVSRALAADGLFFFDLNTERAFIEHWRDFFAIVEEDEVCILRGQYNRKKKIGRYDITLFRREAQARNWHRADTRIIEKCYPTNQIRALLKEANFADIEIYDARTDVKLANHTGRKFFLARKGKR